MPSWWLRREPQTCAHTALTQRRLLIRIVQRALDQLSEREVGELDPERRASMVSNLLVVLCGERSPQPVVNAGTLYSG
jgi:hypothetical protein